MQATMKAIALLVALSCGASTALAARATDPTGQEITVYHWWTSPSESAALSALVKLYGQKYPDVKVLAVPVGGGGLRPLYQRIRRLILAKLPVDAFQSNAGDAAHVFFDAGLLSPIDDVWTADKLEQVIPPVIRDLSKFEGHYYSVPVNVHRTNVVWYNKPLLDKYKIDPATLTTWNEFFKAADTLRAGGIQSPIQMGTTWTAAHVFECIIASQGIATYEQWANGEITHFDDSRLVRALTIFQTYLSYVNKDHGDLGWDAAIRRVRSGDGAFCIMGDWANGEFAVAGMKYGRDYGTLVVPETRGMFGLDVDTFQHPRGIVDETNSKRWLSLAASREGQDAFNPIKGSISARSDADIARYGPYQRSAISDLETAQHLYPNSAAAMPEAFNNQVNDILVNFMLDSNIEKTTRAIAGAAARVRASGQYTRRWSLK